MQLTSRLEDRLGVPLPATLVFDYPSVRDMSLYLQSLAPQSSAAPAAATAVHAVTHQAAAAGGVAAAVAVADRRQMATLVQEVVVGLLGEDGATLDAATPLLSAGWCHCMQFQTAWWPN